jgi:hypothetical protein
MLMSILQIVLDLVIEKILIGQDLVTMIVDLHDEMLPALAMIAEQRLRADDQQQG